MSGRGGGFASAWRHRRWRWLLAGYTVSLTGELLYSVALVVFLLESTGSAGWVAGAAMAQVLACVVLGPVGGVLADWMDRRRLMVGLDLIRSVLMAVLGLVVWSDGPPVVVVALTVVAAAATTPYRPAAVAATPELVPEDDLVAANAAQSIMSSLAFLAGPAIGAVIVAFSDPQTTFVVNAAIFLASAVLVSRVGDVGGRRAPKGTRRADARGRAAFGSDATGGEMGELAALTEGIVAPMWDDIRQGVAIMRRDSAVAAITILAAAVVFQYGAEVVLLPFVARDRLGLDVSGVGLLIAAQGLGALMAAPLMVRLAARRDAGLLLAGSGAVAGATMVALAVISSTPVALVALSVEGISTIVFEVLVITMLQRACPEGVLARIYGLQDSLTAGTQLVGSALAPLLLVWVGLEGGLVFFGVVVGAIAVATGPALSRASAASDDERRRLAPLTEQLAALGILGDASRAALERIARAAVPRRVADGEVVFVEGDEPDDLYVVLAGSFDVNTAAYGVVNRMGAGDWFGEIGLLRGLPRTATVAAATDGELLVIPGAVFVDALAAPDRLPDPLRRTMSRRLVRTHPWLDEPEPDDGAAD